MPAVALKGDLSWTGWLTSCLAQIKLTPTQHTHTYTHTSIDIYKRV